MSITVNNPILPGFYPDPSVCRVGDYFYLVNSTFAYFPGLPIMRSRDLANWEQIGNVMERSTQLPLEGCGHSQGLFAPTIRYHKGVFYVICTNVSGGGNFIVTAENPEGPWSEPFYLEGAGGIDPSLFFDEDDRCYYIGTHPNPDGCKYDGDWYIWIQELDLVNMKLIGQPKDVWNGAMRSIIWPEGPHLYKKDDYYYIVHAEGGTGPDHAVCVCRSKSVFGPYENHFCNPILTHRHLGQNYPVRYVGHGDLVDDAEGNWYMVMLAVRQTEGYTTLGRETFLAKVTWENDWPVVNPGIGRLEERVVLPFDGEVEYEYGCTYDFGEMEKLPPEFLTIRNPRGGFYRLTEQGLSLNCSATRLENQENPSYLGIRQKHHCFEVFCELERKMFKEMDGAGLALVQSNEFFLSAMVREDRAQVVLCEKGEKKLLADFPLRREGCVQIGLKVGGLTADVFFMQEEQEIGTVEEIRIQVLSTEVAGGFVGNTVGMYAEGAGEGEGVFRRFTYQTN